MATYSSSSATGAGSMRAVLMLMLLLGAVVAAHGNKVSCENQCGKPIKVNGVAIGVQATVDVEVDLQVLIELVDKTGVLVSGSYYCPSDVTALVVVYESLFVKVKVKAAGLISVLLGLVLGLFPCNCY